MESIALRALDRLGFGDGVPNDEAGLRAFYRSWCLNVPFDNVRKLIAHAQGGVAPLPGIEAADFLENWIEHGVGGTCWPSSNALFEVAKAAGFQVSRSVASMWDRGIPTHGTVIARLGDQDWAIDSSILTMNPLPLDRNKVFIQEGPLHPVEIEWHEDTFVFWFEGANHAMQFPCRLLQWHAEHEVYADRYEVSRNNGVFNERLFVRRNFPDRLVMLVGNTRWERTAGSQTETLLTEDELVSELLGRHGYSKTIVDRWIAGGGLEAAMKQPQKSPPPPLSRVPPSQRATYSR